MSKEKQITLKVDTKTAIDILHILDISTFGYSKEFAPERIIRLRQVMDNLNKELEKSFPN
jgi:hypothetical protein